MKPFFPIQVLVLLTTISFLLNPTSVNASRPLPLTTPTHHLWSDGFLDSLGIMDHLPLPFSFRQDGLFTLSQAKVDWKETPEGHLMMLDVPGMNKEHMRIEVDKNSRVMKISGERMRDVEENKEGDQWHLMELSYGKFLRQIKLPENVDLESVNAKLDDGVLKVRMVKLPPEKRRSSVKVVDIEEDDREDIKEKVVVEGGSKQEL